MVFSMPTFCISKGPWEIPKAARVGPGRSGSTRRWLWVAPWGSLRKGSGPLWGLGRLLGSKRESWDRGGPAPWARFQGFYNSLSSFPKKTFFCYDETLMRSRRVQGGPRDVHLALQWPHEGRSGKLIGCFGVLFGSLQVGKNSSRLDF